MSATGENEVCLVFSHIKSVVETAVYEVWETVSLVNKF